jgi:hypothetical protein
MHHMEGKMSVYSIVKGRGKWIITHPDKIGEVTVVGNGHSRELLWAIPDWVDDGNDEEDAEEYFVYRGETYFLSEFLRIERNAPSWLKKFDGYHSDSFFSGILIRYPAGDYDDGVKVYTYY